MVLYTTIHICACGVTLQWALTRAVHYRSEALACHLRSVRPGISPISHAQTLTAALACVSEHGQDQALRAQV